VKRARFSKVHVEISSICNLQCSFCPEVIREKKLMEPELFRRIIEQVAPLTEQVAFHLMGDPLVHPRLDELVAITEEHSAKIFLVTNGVLLREKQAELLLRAAFRQVNFSLHSFPDNFGDKDPSEYLKKIFLWTERAFRERPDLYINYRLWNLADVKGSGPHNREILRRVQERFGAVANLDVDVTTQKSRLVKNRLYLHFDTEFTWPALELPVLGTSGTCYGLSSHFGILVDGTVVPCCLDKEGSIPLGNIRDALLSDILGGARAQMILKGFRERRLVESLCQRCEYIERFA
jgi:MoaA/NifB/PqqE/SkfB family radical SAM enzyme